MRKDNVKLPAVELRAELAPDSRDDDSRTVDAAFYTGAEVIRYPLFDDPFLLSFKMDPKSARLDRLNAGAPVLDSHDRYSGVSAVLGVVENGRIEGGEGRATLRFSRRKEVDGVWQDVQDRVLRNLSMGVTIHEMQDLGEDEATGLQRFQATDWEPTEISVLGVGADGGAQIRMAAESGEYQCTIHRAEAAADAQKKGNHMDTIKVRLLSDNDDGKKGEVVEILASEFDATLHSKDLEPKSAMEPSGGDRTKSVAEMRREIDEKLEADRQYQKEIKRIASHYGCDDLWAQNQINLEATPNEAIAAATKERAKHAPLGPNSIGFGDDFDALETRMAFMADAVVARAGRTEPSEAARPYFGKSFADLALECMSARGKGRGLDSRRDVSRILSAELALHSTSDFPLLLANVLNKMLLPAYEEANPTYRRIAVQRTFNDFRPHKFLRGGDFPNLLEVNEHGEFKYGTMSENSESVTAATYGRILGLSRQMLINDDLGGFQDLAMKAGARVADFENATFFAVCIAPNSGKGPALSDATALFDSTAHGNETGAGALSNTLLESAYGLLMAQTSLDGLKLNIPPSLVLTSPTSWGLARRLTTATNPTQASDINTFAGMIEPIADANLSGTRFYVFADPARVPCFVYGYIGGGGPRTESRSGFEVDGVEFKVALDFGVGAIDYRGAVTGAGS